MARKLPDLYHASKKKKSFEKLVERYYGKRDILAAWEEARGKIDPDYIRELKVKLRMYKNDLTYRGHDEC